HTRFSRDWSSDVCSSDLAMASIAGPRVAQIRVRHHARRYGQSKYGLSRIYKVLLDLMVIKTVTTFASRPLRWFAILSLPLLAVETGRASCRERVVYQCID